MSLSPTKKVKYVPDPGNPNLLIPIGTKGKDKEEDVPTKEAPPIDRDRLVVAFEEVMSPLLFQALQPLYTFVGYLEAESGKRLYYRYDPALSHEQKMNPLVKGAVSVDEFKLKNMHLGPTILNLIHEEPLRAPKKELSAARIGINADQFRQLYRQLIDPNATELHFQIFPVQLWDILPTSTLQYILEKSTFGAMEMAAKELKLDLKLLIISDAVNYKFAQFVAKKFISPKQNAFAAGIQGGQMQYRIASGFNTSVQSNTKILLGFRHWFKDVILVDNPALEELDALIQLRYNQLQDVYIDQIRFDARMNRDLDDFPATFKEMTEDQLRRFEQHLVLRQMVETKNEFLKWKYEYDNLRMTRHPRVYYHA